MRTNIKRTLALTAFIAAALALPHSAVADPPSCTGSHADSVSPADKTSAGVKPFTDSYTVTITSPECLNSAGLDALADTGIDLTVGVVGTPTFPPGSSVVEALGLLTFVSSPLHFTALSQDKVFDVDVAATAATTPGDYTYNIGGTGGVSGYGWGVNSGMLTVSVSEPSGGDTTPPVLTIAMPATCPATYTFGASVPIEVDATDAESVITAMSATINGDAFGTTTGLGTNSASVTGTLTPSTIGTYTLAATATSAGGTGTAGPCDIAVNYNFTWLPPISLGKTSKGGSTMPIKFSISDVDGNFVTDESVHVVVKEGTTEVFSAFFGEGASNVRISETDMQYIVNFQTASGVHTYTVCVYFDGVGGEVLQGTKTFSTR
jgi:hypothetical protein